MAKILKWGLIIIVAGLLLIQLVPVERTNPPVTADLEAPDPVAEVLRTACYDCHSHETVWPWYSRVAPISWRIAEHVGEAREHLNFSRWQEMSEEDRQEAREEIWEEVEEGHMPLPDYLRMHPEAVLTEPQMDILRRWSEGEPQEIPDWN